MNGKYYGLAELKPFLPKGTKANKARKAEIILGKHTFTVSLKGETTARKALSTNVDFDFDTKHDLELSLKYLLSREEVQEDIVKNWDPKLTSDAYDFAKPELREDTPQLAKEEAERRAEFLMNVFHQLDNDTILEAVLTEAPKKKDGTLMKNRYVRIAHAGIALGSTTIPMIVASAKSNTELEIAVAYKPLNEDEVDKLRADFLSAHPELLSAKFSGDALNKETVKSGAVETKGTNKKFSAKYRWSSKIYYSLVAPVQTIKREAYLDGQPLSKYPFLEKTKTGYLIKPFMPVLERQSTYDDVPVLFEVDTGDWGIDPLNKYDLGKYDASTAEKIQKAVAAGKDLSSRALAIPTYAKAQALRLLLDAMLKLYQYTEEDLYSLIRSKMPKNKKGELVTRKPYPLSAPDQAILLKGSGSIPTLTATADVGVNSALYPVAGTRIIRIKLEYLSL